MIEIAYFLVFAWFFIHFIECIYFRKTILKSPDGKLKGLIYTFLFGVLYLKKIQLKDYKFFSWKSFIAESTIASLIFNS